MLALYATFKSRILRALAIALLLGLPETGSPPVDAVENVGYIHGFKKIQRNIFGIPYGIGRIKPLPPPGKGNYYRFYYSPGKRLLSVLKIRNGEKKDKWFIRLKYKQKRPVIIVSPNLVVHLAYDGKGRVTKRWIQERDKKKKDGEGDDKFDPQTEETAEEEEFEEPDAKKPKKPFDTFFYYKGREIVRIDQLAVRKADEELQQYLEPKKPKAKDDEDELDEEFEDDEGQADSKKKIPVVKTTLFRAGKKQSYTTTSGGKILHREVFTYNAQGDLVSIRTRKWQGTEKVTAITTPFRKRKARAVVLQDTLLHSKLISRPSFATRPPYIHRKDKANAFKISAGTSVKVLGYQEKFTGLAGGQPYLKVATSGGTTGWIEAWFLSDFAEKLYNEKGIIRTQKGAKIFKAPHYSASVVGVLKLNDKVSLIKKTRGFVPNEWVMAKPDIDYSQAAFYEKNLSSGDELEDDEEFVDDEEFEEEEKAPKKKPKNKPKLKPYEQGSPWYFVKAGNIRGWVHGNRVGERYRRYGNHYFYWHAQDGQGRLYQYNPELLKYQPVQAGVWDLGRYAYHNTYIQRTNWDVRDINYDGQPELLLRRFRMKPSLLKVHVWNDLIVYNLNNKKAYPLLKIKLSELEFNRLGPLGDYVIYTPPQPKKDPQVDEDGEPFDKMALYEVEEEEEEEKFEEGLSDDGQTDAEDLSEEDQKDLVNDGYVDGDVYEGDEADYQFGQPISDQENGAKKPKKKPNYNLRKATVIFKKGPKGGAPYILIQIQDYKPRFNIIGRPLDNDQRKSITAFRKNYLRIGGQTWEKYFHPKDVKNSTDDYTVYPNVP